MAALCKSTRSTFLRADRGPACVSPATRQSRRVVARSLDVGKAAEKIKQSLDFGKNGRLELLDKLYKAPVEISRLEEVMSDQFIMGEEGYERKFSKADYLSVMKNTLEAIPDFNWGHASSGDVDKDGFCIVTVQATGHHTGAPFVYPGCEPLPPSGKHFCLTEEVQKVKVQGNKVVEIEVIPKKGAGPRALYLALGGKLPAAPPEAASATPPMP